MVEAILTKFLVILAVVFFVPKVIYRIKRIPYPISETILGALLGIFLSTFFFIDDALTVLSAIGIITIFISGGMEADLDFIIKKRSKIAEILLLETILVVFFALGFYILLGLTKQVSILLALAAATPSAPLASEYASSRSLVSSAARFAAA